MDSTAPKAAFGLTAVGVFLSFGSAMALLAGTSLARSGTALDKMWRLNPVAYQRLAPLGKPVGVAFVFLGVLLAFASIGWFRRCRWAWWLAVTIIATQVLGDGVNLLHGRLLEGATGALVAGALLFYLLRSKTRAAFTGPRQLSP